MKYMLVFNEAASSFARRTAPDGQKYWDAWMTYMREMGPIIESGAALQGPETGSTVRIRGGRAQIQDGPTPDSKEMLGGYVIIEVPNLDEAIAWAKKCPGAVDGSVEVRPVLPMERAS
jgi:hypothetical protein